MKWPKLTDQPALFDMTPAAAADSPAQVPPPPDGEPTAAAAGPITVADPMRPTLAELESMGPEPGFTFRLYLPTDEAAGCL